MTTSHTKPPTWFWIVAGLALVWNLLGVMAYLTQVLMTPETFELLPPEQQELMKNTPAWATGAFAIAVWGGALGSLLLLIRKKLATPVLMLSLAGLLVQLFHSIFLSNSFDVYGPGGFIMPVMVFGVAVYLVYLSRSATAKGWLN